MNGLYTWLWEFPETQERGAQYESHAEEIFNSYVIAFYPVS